MGDNFNVRVASEGRKHFEAAVGMIFDGHSRATHFLFGGIPERQCLECYGTAKKSHWQGDGPLKDRTEIKLACPNCKDGRLPAEPAMILYWSKDTREGFDIRELPFPLQVDAAVDFLWAWLQSADYGQQPDHDGSNGKGFIVTNGDFWGHCEGSHYSVIMVKPDWQMYGK